MENTVENYFKFKALYFGAPVVRYPLVSKNKDKKFIHMPLSSKHLQLDGSLPPIYLKSLGDISDEDAVGVSYLLYGTANVDLVADIKESYQTEAFNYGFIQILVGDFLRSKGYALPWNGVSVEQQLERGWLKFKK